MRCPGLIAELFLLSEFQRMMSLTLTLYWREIAISVSPLFTVWDVALLLLVFLPALLFAALVGSYDCVTRLRLEPLEATLLVLELVLDTDIF